MGSRERPFLDLNEPPAVDDDEKDDSFCFQPQETLPPTNPHAPDLNVASTGIQGIVNNQAFSHSFSISGFQPFVRSKTTSVLEEDAELMEADQKPIYCSSSENSKDKGMRVMEPKVQNSSNSQIVEKEEAEWSDTERSGDVSGCNNLLQQGKISKEQAVSGTVEGCVAPAPSLHHGKWKEGTIKEGNYINPIVAGVAKRTDELEEHSSQGSFHSIGRMDILATTIGKPDPKGHVRGKAKMIGVSHYVGRPTRSYTQIEPNKELMARIKVQIRAEIEHSLHEEFLPELRVEIAKMIGEIKAKLYHSLREELLPELYRSLREELLPELRVEMRSMVSNMLIGHVEQKHISQDSPCSRSTKDSCN